MYCNTPIFLPCAAMRCVERGASLTHSDPKREQSGRAGAAAEAAEGPGAPLRYKLDKPPLSESRTPWLALTVHEPANLNVTRAVDHCRTRIVGACV